ncbi:MAG: hypothetical protein COV69_04370 [Parcubacteria group bacterium CG11_big_fil_rev_8_21_14_0_20_39_14]|nr:MAG: hypothetical protein COV69_04370 [Parcubacteria group bacterium CG11_big_fil_rev_8_21_14_0_20_39_14]
MLKDFINKLFNKDIIKGKTSFKRLVKISCLTIFFGVTIPALVVFVVFFDSFKDDAIGYLSEKIVNDYLLGDDRANYDLMWGLRYAITDDDLFKNQLAYEIRNKMAGWSDNSGFQYDDFEWVYDAIESTPDEFKVPTDVQREKIYFYTTNNKVTYSPKQLYRQYKNSIVTIIVMNEAGEFAQATGFVIADNGVIATNEHVIFQYDDDSSLSKLVNNIAVVFHGDKNLYPVKAILGWDECNDVAIIKIDTLDKKLTSLPLGDSDKIEIGEKVLSIGSPKGYESSLLDGMVSQIKSREEKCPEKFIQISIPSDNGGSGSPIINERGEVIGIHSQGSHSAFLPPTTSINFAVPINYLKKLSK